MNSRIVKNLILMPCFVSCLVMLSSCSWISSRRSLFGGESEEEASKAQADTVSKKQYDQLMSKYQAAMNEKKMERVETVSDANAVANEMEKAALSRIAEVKTSAPESQNELSPTVDLFSRSKREQAPIILGSKSYPKEMIDDHVNKIREVERLVRAKKVDQAIGLLKELESSPVRQVAVRAKFFLGEILFGQEEYDLALQVYEEILKKNAFSGLVISALGKLIVCSEKLKIESKKEKYYSMLHDFFEQG